MKAPAETPRRTRRGSRATVRAPRGRPFVALVGALLIAATTMCTAAQASTPQGAAALADVSPSTRATPAPAPIAQTCRLVCGGLRSADITNAVDPGIAGDGWGYSDTVAATTHWRSDMSPAARSRGTTTAYGSRSPGWPSRPGDSAMPSATSVIVDRPAGVTAIPAPILRPELATTRTVPFVGDGHARVNDDVGTAPLQLATIGGMLLALVLLALLYVRDRRREPPTQTARAALAGRASALARSLAAAARSTGYMRPQPLVLRG